MKTKLEIDEDLKSYLVEVNNNSIPEYWLREFDWQWRFKFENNYRS